MGRAGPGHPSAYPAFRDGSRSRHIRSAPFSSSGPLRHDEDVAIQDGVPEVVTHYYLAGRRPFLNLSELEEPELAAVFAELNELRHAGVQHRPFGARYMALRRRTEARLRHLFLARGGTPERLSPHYFVLGESDWYESLAIGMQRVQLALSDLPEDQTTVTYPDSFTALGFGPEFGVPREPQPYHGRVFLLTELPELIGRFGVPSPRWRAEHQTWTTWPQEAYIEVQLWTDEAVRQHLTR